jgi:hypothetical protein
MSWYQLLGIVRQQEMEERWYRQRVPSACPRDGEPLTPAPPLGVLFCKFCEYQWPRDGRQI